MLLRGFTIHHVILFQEVDSGLFVRLLTGFIFGGALALEGWRNVGHARGGDRCVEAASHIRLGGPDLGRRFLRVVGACVMASGLRILLRHGPNVSDNPPES
ncbi:hypothetical protein GCM10025781_11640 [Kocuria gwangalliensis]|uniref:Uncharacterized protein n=1 Tax=Kocuria gwangalliensis TaxID=501592 RepID=A0ABP8WVD2_9MICC